MTKRFCDRCGKEIPVSIDDNCTQYPDIRLSVKYNTMFFKNFDLCHECSEKLVAFVTPTAGTR